MLFNYLQTNWIEITGTILSLIYLYLSIKQKISLWIFGFLCSALYVVVFWRSKFYADMSLQFYYLAVSVYGWINWKNGAHTNLNEIKIEKTNLKKAVYLLLTSVLIYFLYYFILKNYTDSPLPKADSFTTALSIVATWMLARKLIENWLLWILIDAVSSGLYFYKQLFPTAILFGIYTIMALVGYLQWRKSISKT
ncbi:MAG: nicotinamide riboside transporter PnuC [Paludibacter sp.]|nr:nicotinamide riboside transporter PnuC [Paludibacter sp.]